MNISDKMGGSFKSIEEWRNEGNEFFKAGNFSSAISSYTAALTLLTHSLQTGRSLQDSMESQSNLAKPIPNQELKSIILRNRSQCHLKLEDWRSAEQDASSVLDLCPGDTKALYRRANAREGLGNLRAAMEDVQRLLSLEPRNADVLSLARRLRTRIEQTVTAEASTSNQVRQMVSLLSSPPDAHTALKAAENLVVLAREESGATALGEHLSALVAHLCALALHERPVPSDDALLSSSAPDPTSTTTLAAKPKRAQLAALDAQIALSLVRCIACFARHNKQRSLAVVREIGSTRLCELLDVQLVERSADRLSSSASSSSPSTSAEGEASTAAVALFERALEAASGLDLFRRERDAYEEERKRHNYQGMPPFHKFEIAESERGIVDECLRALSKMLNSKRVTYVGREAAAHLLARLLPRGDGFGWTRTFIDDDEVDGLERILETAANFSYSRRKSERCLDVRDDTRASVSVLLVKLYDDSYSDRERTIFSEKCERFLSTLLSDKILESKLEALTVISILVESVLDVGLNMLNREGIPDITALLLQDENNAYFQSVALDVLHHAVSKKERCNTLMSRVFPALQQLQTSSDDEFKTRALVILCKIGSSGGSDASFRLFKEGSLQALSKSCKRLLANPSKGAATRRWAVEGLAYLSLDADVKDALAADRASLAALFSFAHAHPTLVAYPAALVLVNLTNSYDEKRDMPPEMVELAKFSKMHIPQEHPRDSPMHIRSRIGQLCAARESSGPNVINALVALASSTDSAGVHELIARVFAAIACHPEHRGMMVANGAVKSLLKLTQSKGNTPAGITRAAHSIAKIGVTMNPELAFPGQRAFQVFKPLISLLHIEHSALENFEALLALTNLASGSDDEMRARLLREPGAFGLIEHYLFEESHEMLRRAAAECVCNLVLADKGREFFIGNNDRIKLLVLYSGVSYDENVAGPTQHENEALMRAASGALATLTDKNVWDGAIECCGKVVSTKCWVDSMQLLLAHPNPELQFRGTYILKNLCRAGEELAQKVVLSPLFEVLLALTTASDEQLEAIAQEFYARLQLPAETTAEEASNAIAAGDETRKALSQATCPSAAPPIENARPIAPVEEVDEEYVSEFPDEDPSASNDNSHELHDAAATAASGSAGNSAGNSAGSSAGSSAGATASASTAVAADEKPAITLDEPAAPEPQEAASEPRSPDASAPVVQPADAVQVPALDPTRKAALRARARQCAQEALEIARSFRLLENH